MALLSAVCALDLVVTGISHDNLDSTLSYTPYAGLDTQRSRLSGHAICIRPMPFLLTRYLTITLDGAVIGGASVKISEAALVLLLFHQDE